MGVTEAAVVETITWWYGVAIAVTAVACFGVRWNVLRGPDRPDASALDGEQIAFLTGGPKRFAAAALARRRIDGDTADLDLRAAAAEVRRGLLDGGWLVPDRRRNMVFFAGMVLGGYVAGAAFVVTLVLMADDQPAGRLAALTAAAVVLGVLVGMRGDRYRSVRRELRRLRGTVLHLRPEARPALVTYGPAAAALAVGLFGVGAMAAVDPDFVTVAAGADVEEPDSGADTGAGCGGCGCGGCGG